VGLMGCGILWVQKKNRFWVLKVVDCGVWSVVLLGCSVIVML
jgi:hypothetical protein